MNRTKIALYIAAAATACSVLGWFLGGLSGPGIGTLLMVMGFLAGLASYILGGLGTAVGMAGRIARWGWYIAPFPFDIMTVILSFVTALYIFAFLPIIPVWKAYRERTGYTY